MFFSHCGWDKLCIVYIVWALHDKTSVFVHRVMIVMEGIIRFTARPQILMFMKSVILTFSGMIFSLSASGKTFSLSSFDFFRIYEGK